MIVSMAIAVLPVWRSPMISSRWPRPIGISASIALMPVWTGVSTDWRTMTPGAIRSTAPGLRGDRALVVERAAERVDDAAEQRLADRDLDDAAGRLDGVAFLDRGGVAEDDRADRLLLEVEGHAHHPARELEHLEGEGGVEAVDLGDAVADLDDGADAAGLDAGVERIDRRLDDAGDLVGADGHRISVWAFAGWRWAPVSAGAREAGSRRRDLASKLVANPLEAAQQGRVDGGLDAIGQPADAG